MNNTYFSGVSAALVLSSVLVAGSAEAVAGGDAMGDVQLIELPVEGRVFGSIVFSDDGSTMAVVSDPSFDEPTISLYEGSGWRPIYKDLFPLLALYVTDMSGDGSVLLFTDFYSSYVYRDGMISNLPQAWANDYGLNFARLFQAAAISDDGETVAIIGHDSSIEYDDDRPLIWSGGTELNEIDIGSPETDDFGYRVVDLSGDGGLVAINAQETGQINDLRNGPADKAYLWDQGDIIEIPQPAFDLELSMWAQAVSEDGNAVVGTANAPFREDAPFGPPYWHENSAAVAWIWNRDRNESRTITADQYESVYLSDVNEDGSIVLGNAYDPQLGGGEFIWVDGQGMIFTNQLFTMLKINLGVDSYSFSKISNDGTHLMGVGFIDDQAYALIVTIPDLTP